MNNEIRDILDFLQENDRINTTDKRKLRHYIEDLESKQERILAYIDKCKKSFEGLSAKEITKIIKGE